ncbi:MAG: DUF885 domain-containing protein [Planctomycetes bacterium]|nr:DUF885 domain-containing protein [Planctomycetota bacterium]
MSRRSPLALAFLGFLVVSSFQTALPETRAADSRSPFARFVDDYFDAYFAWKPSEGTAAGFHQYDHRLEDRSAGAFARRIQTIKSFQKRLKQLRAGELTPDEAIDAEVLDSQIQAELLDLETLRNWRRNPMDYIGTPAGAVDLLMKRDFAPAGDRLRSVIARLKLAPAVLTALRANIDNPPREFTELAIRMGDGAVTFFQDSVSSWAEEAAGKDDVLLAEFEAANTAFLKALREGVAWMKDDLLPRSRGHFALGAENFHRKLLYEEMVDLPLDKLLALGQANLRRDHEAFVTTARKIDPNRTPAEVMKSLSADHPAEGDLVPAARRTIEKTRQFLIDHHIVTVPSEVRPTVLETPPFARNGAYASMDTPGAYETRATEAFYYVTPTEKDWTPEHKEQHLRLFNTAVMQIITIHEAFPGHYIQFLYAKQFPTKTRKLVSCNTNVEGWAHYTEQMMVEEGYGGGDPRIRLAQLSEALLRDCRFVVGIRLHTEGMTVAEGAKFFEEEGFQEPAVALEETLRATYNPTYLYYTLGKLQIYELRSDYRRARGKEFSLAGFHDDFVRQGGLPIKLLRRILLPGKEGNARERS